MTRDPRLVCELCSATGHLAKDCHWKPVLSLPAGVTLTLRAAIERRVLRNEARALIRDELAAGATRDSKLSAHANPNHRGAT